MRYSSDCRRNVRYELMLGREATAAMAQCPVGYLPVGCLERHGDHLPMGLDVLKAHGICCLLAQTLGGVVFPPHYYAGVHRMSPEQLRKYTGEWGNVYTDASAGASLTDVIRQLGLAGLKVLVLYTGHYPACQCDMVREIAAGFNSEPGLRLVPFAEPFVLQGDHAGVSETSLMLYLDRTLVDMSRIGPTHYSDHGWTEANTPERATLARGEAEFGLILEHLRSEVRAALVAAT